MNVEIKDLIGIPYKVHGRNKEEGFDCYGLAIEILRRCDKILPDFVYTETDVKHNIETARLIKQGVVAEKIEQPVPYCLIDIATADECSSHIGVYLGSGTFIHSTSKHGVCLQSLSLWKSKIKGYYKIGDN